MGETAILIGPGDVGRRMSLDEFDRAETVNGQVYELSRGVVTVVDVPGKPHADQVFAAHRQFHVYSASNPQHLYRVFGGSDCKTLDAGVESERHPDAAIYKTPPVDEENLWQTWIPDLVVEVVSRSSIQRDYVEKREEYLRIGVREYWIINRERGEAGEMLVLRRVAARWVEQIVRPRELYRPALLPGFEFNLEMVFAAADH